MAMTDGEFKAEIYSHARVCKAAAGHADEHGAGPELARQRCRTGRAGDAATGSKTYPVEDAAPETKF
jgi:hypothetical protein